MSYKVESYLKEHISPIRWVSYSNNGKYVATAGYDNVVNIWDGITFNLISSFTGHDDLVEKVSWSENDSLIGSASADGTAKVWDPASGTIIAVLRGHLDDLLSVKVSESKKIAVTTAFDNQCIVWDLKESEKIKYIFKDHTHYVNDTLLTEDSDKLLTVSNDGRVIKYDLLTGKKLWDTPTFNDLNSVEIIGDNVMVVGDNCRLNIIDYNDGNIIRKIKIHDAPIKTICKSKDEKIIATGSYDRTIKVFSYPDLNLLDTIHGDNKWENSISISSDNKILIAGSFNSKFFAYNLKDREELCIGSTKTNGINALDSYEDLIAVAGDKGSIQVIDLYTNKVVLSLQAHNSIIQSLKFSPNGEFIAATSYDETISLINIKEKAIDKVFKDHDGIVNTVDWNADGDKLVTGGYDGLLRIWDVNTGRLIKKIHSDDSVIKSVIWNHKFNLIAVAQNSRTIYVYDAQTFKLVGKLTGHSALINQIAWSPFENLIVSASRDKTIMIHDIETFESSVLIDKAHRKSIKSITWSKTGEYIVSGSYDTKVKIWNYETGELVKEISNHSLGVAALTTTFSNKILTGGWDGQITISHINKHNSEDCLKSCSNINCDNSVKINTKKLEIDEV